MILYSLFISLFISCSFPYSFLSSDATDLDNLLIRVSSEMIEAASYSSTVNFSHTMIVESAGNLGRQGSCSTSQSQYLNGENIMCTTLNHDSPYMLLVQGVVTCYVTNHTAPLEFVLEFASGTAQQEVM